jgi:hypothetical protein
MANPDRLLQPSNLLLCVPHNVDKPRRGGEGGEGVEQEQRGDEVADADNQGGVPVRELPRHHTAAK